MGAIAQYLNPALWGEGIRPGIEGFGGAAFWLGLPQIVLINVVLSGDTAMVIAMTCRELPPRQRLVGVAVGSGTAALLLIVFAVILTPLLLLPYVKLIGGLALMYIAVRLLVPEAAGEEGVEAATHLWRVVRIVALADLILSLDNIIAIAAVAQGNFALLMTGLAVSIPIVFLGATLMMVLLARFPLLVWAGAALLGWVAGETIATDRAVVGYLIAGIGEAAAHRTAIAAAGVATLAVIGIGVVLRRRR
ncbi:MAG: YjbE family putative metal transport protein [Xanthobacteraceae bacterium]|nr:YjbE family putative metal transport protein [Xanthobacteraceae bacterium]